MSELKLRPPKLLYEKASRCTRGGMLANWNARRGSCEEARWEGCVMRLQISKLQSGTRVVSMISRRMASACSDFFWVET